MACGGWIKLHREITEHWLWDCEFSYAQAWIDLLIKACHKPSKLMIKGQVINLERGQQARSEVTLSRDWKWSRGKVRRFLSQCLKDGMITQETTHLTSIITICNYDNFQQSDTASGTTERTSGDTPSGQLTVHKQEIKNLRSEEIKDFSAVADKKKEPPAKGTRIQPGWEMPQEWIDDAAERLSIDRGYLQRESERFADYWMAQPGSKGVKLNWQATWRNWVRNAVDRNPGLVKQQGAARSRPRAFGE